jgi:hypothetical protein
MTSSLSSLNKSGENEEIVEGKEYKIYLKGVRKLRLLVSGVFSINSQDDMMK